MKKVTSLVVFLFVLVLALWAGATYWFGIKTEQRYNAIIKDASQLQGLKFVNVSYNRGFLGSTARTVMEVEPPAGVSAPSAPIRLTLLHDIQHGPFPLGKTPDGGQQFKPVMGIINTTISLSPETQGELTKLYGQFPEVMSMRNYTIIQLDGSGEEHFFIPAFQHSFGSEDKAAVDWKGLSFRCNFSPGLKGFKGSLSIPGLDIAQKEFRLQLKEVKSSFDFQEDSRGLSLGEASLDFTGLKVDETNEKEPHSVAMQGLKVHGSSKATGDNVNFLFSFLADPLKIDDLSYGPGVFEMEFRNLDAASLARLQQAVRESQTDASQKSPVEKQMKLLATYTEVATAMLKKSPEAEITRLELKTADGDFSGKAKVAVDGTKAQSVQDLAMLTSAVKARAEFKIAERLVHRVAKEILKDGLIEERKEQTGVAPSAEELDTMVTAQIDEQLGALVAQNLLTKENGEYKASATFEAGQVVLNGRPLQLEGLLQ